jgi:hypothetical protein
MFSSNTPNEWTDWALERIDVLVASVKGMDDEDFSIPEQVTTAQAEGFVKAIRHRPEFAQIGRPNIWLSQNGDFVFGWKREGAKLEFKFTPNEMLVFVKTGDKTFEYIQSHSKNEPERLVQAVTMYELWDL